MKLHSGNVRSLHDGGERLAVLSHSDGFTHQRSDITMCEVHLRLIGHAFENRRFALHGERVPPDMWNLDRIARCEPPALPRQEPKPRQLGRLVASLEQPMHAEANAEQGPAFANALEDALDPGAVERSRR